MMNDVYFCKLISLLTYLLLTYLLIYKKLYEELYSKTIGLSTYLFIYLYTFFHDRLKLESKIKLESIISEIKALKQKH